MKLTRIALRNILRNRRRSALSIIALAVAAVAMTFMFALLEGISRDVQANSWNYDAGEVRIRHRDYDRYEYLNPVQYVVEDYRDLLRELQGLPEVAVVSPRIRVPAVTFREERQIAAFGLGLDMNLEQQYQDLEAVVVRGRLPHPGTSEAIVGSRLAEELGVDVGDIVTFLTQTRQRSSNAFTVDVVGIASFPVSQLNQRAFILPLESAERYMRMDGGASEILLKSTDGETDRLTEAVRAFLDAPRSPGGPGEPKGPGEPATAVLHAVPWTEISGGYEYLQMARAVYNIIALFFFLLASTVIISTTMMIVHERTREIGTLAAIGMHKGELTRLFFTESALLGAIGSILGVGLGSLMMIPFIRSGLDFGGALDMVEMDMSSVIYPVLNLRSTLVVAVFAFLVATLASFPSARGAAKLEPVEALRAE